MWHYVERRNIMFDHDRLTIEAAKERMQRHIQEAEDYHLYRQLGHRDGTVTWFVVLIVLIALAVLFW